MFSAVIIVSNLHVKNNNYLLLNVLMINYHTIIVNSLVYNYTLMDLFFLGYKISVDE